MIVGDWFVDLIGECDEENGDPFELNYMSLGPIIVIDNNSDNHVDEDEVICTGFDPPCNFLVNPFSVECSDCAGLWSFNGKVVWDVPAPHIFTEWSDNCQRDPAHHDVLTCRLNADSEIEP